MAAVWSIKLDEPELETRQLSATWQMIHDWFVCRPQASAPTIRIECENLRIRDADAEQSLEQIAVEIYAQSERTVVGAQFRMPSAAADSKPALLRIVRQHGDRHLSTVLELDSGQTGLPCNLISPVLPLAKQLGPAAIFMGQLSLHQRNHAWQINLSKSWFAGIDFGQLSSSIGTRLTGNGRIWCESLKVTERGLQNIIGGVIVEHGRIDENLLNASERLLGVTLPRQVQMANVEWHSFEKLCGMFEISPGLLKLAGAVEPTALRTLPPGTLISDAAGEIAVRAEYEKPIPLQNLAAALGYAPSVATASATSGPSGTTNSLDSSWFAQRAAWWLPLGGAEPLSQADATASGQQP